VYGISGTFTTEEARSAHLSGEIPVALGAVASRLLAAEPRIRAIDIIAAKQRARLQPAHACEAMRAAGVSGMTLRFPPRRSARDIPGG